MSKRLILSAAPLLLLAACSDAPDTAGDAEQGGEAAGELLGGTISDEMIPLEQLQSQSPPAPRAATASDDEGEGEEAGETDSEGAETAEAEAAPAAPAPPAPSAE